MRNLILTCTLFCIASCSTSETTSLAILQKEANDYCQVHSVKYWEKRGILKQLRALGPNEMQDRIAAEINAVVNSKEMSLLIYEGSKVPLNDYYAYLQKRIPELTKQPFECQPIVEFYTPTMF